MIPYSSASVIPVYHLCLSSLRQMEIFGFVPDLSFFFGASLPLHPGFHLSLSLPLPLFRDPAGNEKGLEGNSLILTVFLNFF